MTWHNFTHSGMLSSENWTQIRNCSQSWHKVSTQIWENSATAEFSNKILQ